MKHRKRILLLLLTSILAGYGSAQDDEEDPDDFDWNNYDGDIECYYVHSSAGDVRLWEPKVIHADSNLCYSHLRTDDGTRHSHWHTQYDFGDTGSPCSVSEANTYWDYRFLYCGNSDDATNEYMCHLYAAQQTGCGGAYNYTADLSAIETLFEDTLTERTEPDDVYAGDILRYSSPGHSTIVANALANVPYEIRWKWGWSGIYSYTVQSGTEWDTPMCDGGVDPGATLAQQDWTWTESYVSSPDIYYYDP